ncbi:MAG TPA: crossover junction endodeoxyribonuclease RuvC [Vicinamibacterales bacterium]|nr:crossover junction endodeoxyribonuclease RuvC [Vicinamibacterales bacterium]
MKIFGIDPGSDRTGYGCILSDGNRHRLVTCGALRARPHAPFPERLLTIYDGLSELLASERPDCVALEDVFHARNVRSALTLGHARGVALLAAARAGLPVAAYSPAQIKRTVTGYGRAEKRQIQIMIRLLLGLDAVPSPHDAADALAVAICHLHHSRGAVLESGIPAKTSRSGKARPSSWRDYRPAP